MPKRDKPSLIVRKTKRGIVPVSAFDAESLDALPLNAEFDVFPRIHRSNPQNRLYWQLLSNVIKACGSTIPPALLHDRLKKRLGYTFLYRDLDGSLKEDVDSTAFNNMEQADFQIYMDAAMKELAEMVGFDPFATLQEQAA